MTIFQIPLGFSPQVPTDIRGQLKKPSLDISRGRGLKSCILVPIKITNRVWVFLSQMPKKIQKTLLGNKKFSVAGRKSYKFVLGSHNSKAFVT